jgi:hypothetical protein
MVNYYTNLIWQIIILIMVNYYTNYTFFLKKNLSYDISHRNHMIDY